jgi:hypothetical protein
MKLSGKLPLWAILALFLMLGLALIVIPHFFEWQWDYGITPEIGIALLVASILGFTIDRWMKAELRTDVFLASIGHILAPEFRAEVSRIVGYSLICERHFLLIKIKSIGTGLVRITSHVERTIRNRSAYPQSIRNITHIDEWGYQKAGASEVVECILEIDGVPTGADEPKKDAYSVYRQTTEKTLKPGQVANLRSKYVEYKPINDDLHYSFAAPTINPEIEVQVSDDLDCIFNFGTPTENAENVVVSKYAPKKQLIGTYFPHQAMRVRWWPKPKEQKA